MQENQHTEFKSNFSDAVIESLVAFANAKGGKVLVGIDNKGNPAKDFTVGTESIQKWINEIKNKTQPSIIPDAEIVNIQGKDAASISIPEFPVKPVSFKGRYYKRVNNSNHQLSLLEITDLSLQSLQISWDSYQAHGKSISDLDMQKVAQFTNKVNAAGRFQLGTDLLNNLEKLKLIKGETITNAAWLLFANDTTGYNIHLGRFKTPSMIIDDKMFNGTLFEMVEETMRYLISQIKVAFEIKGMPTQRTEIFEYPLPALREIALNTLIHRNYLSPIDVQIRIYDNEVEFYNPGTLYGNLTIAELKKDNYRAIARNKLIAEAFYLTGDIEKYGSGFLRIRKEIASYPTMQLNFDEIPNGFLISLKYKAQKISTMPTNEGLSEGLNEGLSEGLKSLLAEINKNPGIQAKDLAIQLENRPIKTIERQIKELVNQQLIERRGSRKTGGYFTIEGANK